MDQRKFETGRLVATAAVDERMRTDKDFRSFCENCIRRHFNGDWGDLEKEDKAQNELALRHKSLQIRMMSQYIFREPDDKLWIITEADRSVTTVLFPWDY